MFTEILSKKTRNVLSQIGKSQLRDKFYLAGGTGAALQLGHRLSLDLDFFTQRKFESPELELLEDLKEVAEIRDLTIAPGTLHCKLGGVRASFFQYRYPVLFSFSKIENVKVADVRDIGLMKITAISDRGSKKDFIDLYFITKEVTSLAELLKLFPKKYKAVDYNMVHIIKSLVYFLDADKEEAPHMLKEVAWNTVKSYFIQEVKKLPI